MSCFSFRSLASKNCKGCFHCNLCSSDNKCKVRGLFQMNPRKTWPGWCFRQMPSSTPNFQHRVRMEEIRFDVSTSVEFCSVHYIEFVRWMGVGTVVTTCWKSSTLMTTYQKTWSASLTTRYHFVFPIYFYTFISSDLELGPKRKEGERGILIWKVAKTKFSMYFWQNITIGTVPSLSSPQCWRRWRICMPRWERGCLY